MVFLTVNYDEYVYYVRSRQAWIVGRKVHVALNIDRFHSPSWHCSSFDSNTAVISCWPQRTISRKNGGKLLLNVSSLSNVLFPFPAQISFEASYKCSKRFSFRSMREHFTSRFILHIFIYLVLWISKIIRTEIPHRCVTRSDYLLILIISTEIKNFTSQFLSCVLIIAGHKLYLLSLEFKRILR